jgi:hypothetical protein
MTRIAGANVLFALLTLTGACGVGGGDGSGSGSGGGSGGTVIPPTDNSEVCAAAFTLTGTFTPGATPRPTDPDTGLPLTGCWPIGTWNFTAKVDTASPNTCATAPAVLPSYSFKVERTADPASPTETIQTITSLMTLTGGMQYHIAMSSNGQGCEGSFEFGTADGKDYWNMKPVLAKDPAATAITGGGDYVEYKGNSWPWQ